MCHFLITEVSKTHAEPFEIRAACNCMCTHPNCETNNKNKFKSLVMQCVVKKHARPHSPNYVCLTIYLFIFDQSSQCRHNAVAGLLNK